MSASTNKDNQNNEIGPRNWMIILIVLIALVTIAFTILWMLAWQHLHKAIWNNDFVENHSFMIPVLVIVISLLIGLCIKYLHAKTVISGGPADSMKGEKEPQTHFKEFWGTLPSSIFSLVSGAAVGPEGPLALLVEDISGWVAQKLKMAKETRFGFVVAGLSSAYNGLFGSPVFTAVFATEFHGSTGKSFKLLGWSLLAGVIGFFFFIMTGLKSYLGLENLPAFSNEQWIYLLYAVLLGVLGTLITAFAAVMFKVFEKLMRLLGDKVVLRMLLAGAVIGIVLYFVPHVAFSGQEVIGDLIENPAKYGIGLLLLYGLLKVVMMALAFKSGYLGGPIFPVMFSCTAVALALSLVFPGVPLMILVLCTEAAGVTLLLSAPLTAILITTVVSAVGGVNYPFMLGLIVLSVVTAMIVGPGIKKLIERLDGRSRASPNLAN